MYSQEDSQKNAQILNQFGSVFGNVEKQEFYNAAQPNQTAKNQNAADAQECNPIYLNKDVKGNKIDFIRVINSLYELGFFVDKTGARPSKKDVFIALGNALHIDMSNYSTDLSQSLSNSAALDKNLSIFNRMQKKMVESFNNFG